MARAVLNTFSLRVSKNHRDEMLDAMITILLDVESKKTSKGIASALNMQANLVGEKIKVLKLYTGLHLTSGWGPALEAQDGLCKLLSKVDERVVLANSPPRRSEWVVLGI